MSALRAAAGPSADDARHEAEQILRDRRFHSDPAPRPLRGPLRWIGQRLESVFRAIGHVIELVPGVLWLTLAFAVLALVIARIIVTTRRRRVDRGTPAHVRRLEPDDTDDPDELERAADAAERDGDLDRAIRLRFRAGLLRLGDRGAIVYRPSVTTAEVRRALGSQTFDELARTFEGVAYGGRTATQPDVDNARDAWPRILEDARQ